MTVATIPASCSFLDNVARFWLEKEGTCSGEEGTELGERGVILVPGRRAARGLMEAFLRVLDGRAALLPDIIAIGDVGESDLFPLALEAETPPPVEANRRLAVLAQLILHMPLFRSSRDSISLERVWPLAQALAELMDEAERCGVDLKKTLPQAVEEEFAHHWEQTLHFLQIVTDFWPEWLKEQGLSNPVSQHRTLLEAHGRCWQESPPSIVIWAIGFSDGMGGVAEFLKIVASLPLGTVILQAVDLELDEALWDVLPESHPQYPFRDLLEHMGVRRSELELWGESLHPVREALIRDVMLPEAGLSRWAEKRDCSALSDLSLLPASDVQQEAGAIALILRDVASQPGRSAALVTPDRDLAQRVRSSLLRYGIHADDSAGISLGQTPVAVFLRLIAEAASSEFAPVSLLALLKHPFTSLGMKAGSCRSLARLLERNVLRGPAPEAGFPGLYAALEERVPAESDLKEKLKEFLWSLEGVFRPLLDLTGFQPMPVWLEALVSCAESLALQMEGEEQSLLPLWEGDDGAMLSRHLTELMTWMGDLPPEGLSGLAGFLTVSMSGMALRGLQGHQGGVELAHPRISILGVLEARLLSFDVVIAGGLSETNWPPAVDPGPWLSRPMRRKIGLLSPEKVIGQSAHDFVTTILASQKAVLAYARREGGRPAVMARWLARFEAYLSGQSVLWGQKKELAAHPALGWQSCQDLPLGDARPVSPPQPRPPLVLRPGRFSITEIDMLVKDPYGLYAKRILRLKALKPLEEEAELLVFGNLVHQAMEDMVRHYPCSWPENAVEELTGYFEKALRRLSATASLKAWWGPRLKNIASWVCEQEMLLRREPERFRSFTEIEAEWEGKLSSGRHFHLNGRADRIDLIDSGNKQGAQARIFDYKTGTLPDRSDVLQEWSAQLVLEAALLAQGAFKGLPAAQTQALIYWKLSGGAKSGEVLQFPSSGKKVESLDFINDVLEHVRELIEGYDQLEQPYLSRPRVGHVLRYSDYEQLARVDEWFYNNGGE
ncbi:double-strand break repair protein AddB [Acetobacteraceae bacterium ESL0709]|nr:double-strand break repair protein AddB [Acetobacteraceae bacterium ESL0697]MDF7677349.1 double-strand break repair protein AddB [Acetobacteraceae bacterium ESL0709]